MSSESHFLNVLEGLGSSNYGSDSSFLEGRNSRSHLTSTDVLGSFGLWLDDSGVVDEYVEVTSCRLTIDSTDLNNGVPLSQDIEQFNQPSRLAVSDDNYSHEMSSTINIQQESNVSNTDHLYGGDVLMEFVSESRSESLFVPSITIPSNKFTSKSSVSEEHENCDTSTSDSILILDNKKSKDVEPNKELDSTLILTENRSTNRLSSHTKYVKF